MAPLSSFNSKSGQRGFRFNGFSIAASLEQTPFGFYRRRVLRIWPLYLGCIAFGLLVALLRTKHGLT